MQPRTKLTGYEPSPSQSLFDESNWFPWKAVFLSCAEIRGLSEFFPTALSSKSSSKSDQKDLKQGPSNPSSDASSEVKASSQATDKIQAWHFLLQALPANQVKQVYRFACAKQAWEYLLTIFERSTQATELSVHRQLLQVTMLPDEKVVTYVERIRSLIDQLRVFGQQYNDTSFLTFIFSGLRPEFELCELSLKSSSVSSSAVAIQALLDYEDKILAKQGPQDSSSSSGPAAFLASKFSRQRSRSPVKPVSSRRPIARSPSPPPPSSSYQRTDSRDSRFCQHCKKSGHTRDNCFQLFPEQRPAHWHYRGNRQPQSAAHNVSAADDRGYSFQVSNSAVFHSPSPVDTSVVYVHLDSGCSQHLFGDRSFFPSLDDARPPTALFLANGVSVPSDGVGKVVLNSVSGPTFNLSSAIYAKGFQNLLSVSALDRDGYRVVLGNGKAVIHLPCGKTLSAPRRAGLYTFPFHAPRSQPSEVLFTSPSDGASSTPQSVDLWHQRLGHLHFADIKRLQSMSKGLPALTHGKQSFCQACALCKSKRPPFDESKRVPGGLGDLVVVDIFGPITPKSQSGDLYITLFRDVFSGYVTVRLSSSKDMTTFVQLLEEYVVALKNRFSKTLKVLRSDNAFNARVVHDFCKSRGIHQEFSAPHTPQQNGIAERAGGVLISMASTMLNAAGLPKSLWSEAVFAAAYIRNRCPTAGKASTPFEMVFGEKPKLSHLRVYGCRAIYTNLHHPKGSKFFPRGKSGFLVGYDRHSKAYRIWSPSEHRVIISRDVKFDELTFCGSASLEKPGFSPSPAVDGTIRYAPALWPSASVPSEPLRAHSPAPDARPLTPIHDSNRSDSRSRSPPAPDSPIQEDDFSNHSDRPDDSDHETSPVLQHAADPFESVSRPPRSPPPALPRSYDFESFRRPSFSRSGVSFPDRSAPANDHRGDSTPRPAPIQRDDADDDDPQPRRSLRVRELNKHVYDKDHVYSVSVLNLTAEPQTYRQAISCADSEHWRLAMQKEFSSLQANETWSLTSLPPNRKAIPVKWVYKLKPLPDGSTTYKARLVAKGFLQREGKDFQEDELFTPVAKISTVRMFLALAVSRSFEVHHLDIGTAFLNGLLKEEVYIKQPPGFEVDDVRACRLHKALYGLRQASHAWNERLTAFMLEHGFKQSILDPCLFTLRHKSSLLIVIVFVDDILAISSDSTLRIFLVDSLKKIFDVHDLGHVRQYLGLSINYERKSKTLSINQEPMIQKLLAKYNMSNAAPNRIPLTDSTLKELYAYKASVPAPADLPTPSTFPVREVIGSLLYIANCSRPDLSVTVSRLSQFAAYTDSELVWKALKQVLRYLAGTTSLSLIYSFKAEPSAALDLRSFCDATWADNPLHRRSTSGFVHFLQGFPFAWQCKRQSQVALSTMDAEFVALASCCQDLVWFSRLLENLDFSFSFPSVFCDNQPCIQSVKNNGQHHTRAKHIDIKYHFVRELLESKKFVLSYIPTKENFADFFTKPLSTPIFCIHRFSIFRDSRYTPR